MNGKELLETLQKIREGETYDIFSLLPEVAGGADWMGEIKDCAMCVQGYIQEGEEYEVDDLRDKGWQYAETEVEDYYSNINKRVQELGLWASGDLDEQIAEMHPLGDGEMTLTRLHSLYLYCAMRMVWDAVVDQAFQNTEEMEMSQ